MKTVVQKRKAIRKRGKKNQKTETENGTVSVREKKIGDVRGKERENERERGPKEETQNLKPVKDHQHIQDQDLNLRKSEFSMHIMYHAY